MHRVFSDMDGVAVDFDGYMEVNGLTSEDVKQRPGAYAEMTPMPGAIAALRSIIGMGFELWMATKPPTGRAFAYADKAQWIFTHIPELRRRIIITHDKGLLGDEGDFLIDDRPHKANCERFKGTLITFNRETFAWPQVLDVLRRSRPPRGTRITP